MIVPGVNGNQPLCVHAECALGFSVRLLEQLARFHADQTIEPSAAMTDLSPRERQVLDGIVRGERDKEIADRLGIAEHTVKNHAYDIRRKIGARSRTEAAMWAMRVGPAEKPASQDERGT
ncbi:MAG: hypothetical protein NVSMB22_09960 [Chloroflexota bacterium]